MIFVTVGTQSNGFQRCLKEVEELVSKYNISEEVVAQIGYTKFQSNKLKCLDFITENQYTEFVSNARLIITHAGSGALFQSMKHGKKVIAMARLHKYNEIADDHQLELLSKLANDGYILDGTDSLERAYLNLENFKPRELDFKNNIISCLDSYISKYINKLT